MTDDSPTARMERALQLVRREGYKVAVVYAAVDGAAVALLVNLVVRVLPVPAVPETVGLPGAVVTAVEALGVTLVEPTVTGGAVLGVLAGLTTFVLEVGIRTRRPLIEQFEAANPAVREALRTARDAVEDGVDNSAARRLYADVLDRLGETSSVALLDVRRVGLTLVVVLVLSVASLQVAVYDVSLAPGNERADAAEADPPEEYTGLHDADDILGEATNVSAGDEEMEARIGTTGEGDGSEATEVPRDYDTGFASAGDVESQQAEFTTGEQLEDADLIREYTLRIREETDE